MVEREKECREGEAGPRKGCVESVEKRKKELRVVLIEVVRKEGEKREKGLCIE